MEKKKNLYNFRKVKGYENLVKVFFEWEEGEREAEEMLSCSKA